MIYNTIKHDIRNNANLSLLDYCLLESIYLLSNSDKSKYKNWCNAAKSSFEYLSSARTIVTRFNELEKDGWLEFYDESRMLKRTTKKYYDEVYSYIIGVKKLHCEETAPVQLLHTPYAETAHLSMQKLHTPYAETAPNNNIDNTIDNNIEKERENARTENSDFNFLVKKIEELSNEVLSLKTEKEKEKKVAQKKEKDIPPHKTDIQQSQWNNSLKQYEVAIQDYDFSSWTKTLHDALLSYFKSSYEVKQGKFYGNQAKEAINLVLSDVDKHGEQKVENCLKLCAREGWVYNIQIEIDRANKENKNTLNKNNLKGLPILEGDLKDLNTWKNAKPKN